MTRPARTNRVLPLSALLAVAFAAPALAQGTDAQRKACAPDAINLCSDTIPDVDKTEACMRRHFNELSPACKTAFNDATGGAPPPARGDGQSARGESGGRGRAPDANEGYPEQDIPGGRQYGYAQPSPLDDGLDTSRDVIARLCSQGMIDPGTCRRTARMLNMR